MKTNKQTNKQTNKRFVNYFKQVILLVTYSVKINILTGEAISIVKEN